MADKNNMLEMNEIDVIALISKLWDNRKTIIKWCVAGVVIGLVVGFSLPKKYYASVVLAPETEQRIGSGVSSIASMMGVSLDNSVDAIGLDMFPDVVSSTPFLFDLLDLPVKFERKDSVITTDLLDYLLEYQKSPWWSHVIGAPFKLLGWVMSIGKEEMPDIPLSEMNQQNLPRKVRRVIDYLSHNINVSVDKKTGKTTISLFMQDPFVVSTVVETVKDNLVSYITSYRTSKVRQNVDNLTRICDERRADYYRAQQAYASYVDANKSVVLLSAQAEQQRLQQEMNLAYQVYSQVATQLEAARIKVQEAKPVFAVLEPVSVPDRKAAPSKAKILIAFVFMAGLAASAWILWVRDFYRKMKN